MDASPPVSPPLIPNAEGGIFDVVIVGAGPVGLYAAFYAGLRQLTTLIVDCQAHVGGQLASLYPHQTIYDSPGYSAMTALRLVSSLRRQTELAAPHYTLNCRIDFIERQAQQLILKSSDKTFKAKAVLIAAGAGALSPKRLGIPNAARWEGNGLHYTPPELMSLRDKRVMIVGSGEAATDLALQLEPVASSVCRVSRRPPHSIVTETFHSIPRQTHQFANAEVTALNGTNRLELVTLTDYATNQSVQIPVDHLIVLNGYDISLQSVLNWNVQTNKGGIVVDSQMRTSLPGVYAAGDIASYEGKLRLIANGFAEAATAINHAKQYIDPTAPLFPGHSTSVAVKRLPGLRGT